MAELAYKRSECMSNKLSFEKTLSELESIVTKMESRDTTLDESLALFNNGVKLSTACMEILSESKGKVELLVKELEAITKSEFTGE